MDDFYMVLPSNASMDVYPRNKLSSFTVRLPFLHRLDPDWTVALADISYTKSWFNVGPGNYANAVSSLWGSGAGRFEIPPGNYESPEKLVDAINEASLEFTKGVIRGVKAPVFDVVKQRFNVRSKGAIDHDGKSETVGIPFTIEFSEQLREILGIDRNRPIYLNQGLTSLYVYSDIVYPTIIGDTTGPLLRVINVDNETPFGVHETVTFDKPYYHKLAHNTFQEITVYIRTDTGKVPHFNFGRVVVTLHFKRK